MGKLAAVASRWSIRAGLILGMLRSIFVVMQITMLKSMVMFAMCTLGDNFDAQSETTETDTQMPNNKYSLSLKIRWWRWSRFCLALTHIALYYNYTHPHKPINI